MLLHMHRAVGVTLVNKSSIQVIAGKYLRTLMWEKRFYWYTLTGETIDNRRNSQEKFCKMEKRIAGVLGGPKLYYFKSIFRHYANG